MESSSLGEVLRIKIRPRYALQAYSFIAPTLKTETAEEMPASANSNKAPAAAAAAAMAVGAGFLLGAATTYWLWKLRGGSISVHQDQDRNSNNNNNNNLDEGHPAPRRFGGAIRLKPEQYQRYRELHDNVWDQVLERMYQSNIRNFVIYYHKETSTLFQSFEWIGHWQQQRQLYPINNDEDDEAALFQRDMAAIASDPVTRSWWMECEPCQEPFAQWKTTADAAAADDDDGVGHGQPPSQGGSGDWWAPLECVCHTGHWPTSYSRQRRDPDFVKLKDDDQSTVL